MGGDVREKGSNYIGWIWDMDIKKGDIRRDGKGKNKGDNRNKKEWKDDNL